MNDEVKFPLFGLDLAPFCSEMGQLNESDRFEIGETKYDLLAVVVHMGSFHGIKNVIYFRKLF